MLPDRVSNPGPLIYESGALPIALRRPAHFQVKYFLTSCLPPISLGVNFFRKDFVPFGAFKVYEYTSMIFYHFYKGK